MEDKEIQNGQCKKPATTYDKSSVVNGWLFVALDGILSNEFIEGLRKLHELQGVIVDKGLIPASA